MSRKSIQHMNTIVSKNGLLMESLTNFFIKNGKIEDMLPIVKGDSKISLRIIDWFVTNYSKKHNITFPITNGQFIVYLNYKSQLKAYSKKQFDPFCRRERITFCYGKGEDKEMTTTVGQLNFFRWAIENGILKYIKTYLKDIEGDMNKSIRHLYNRGSKNKSKKRKSKKKGENMLGGSKKKRRKKRHELSTNASKRIQKHTAKVIVEFD
jgi:hypothetical protein